MLVTGDQMERCGTSINDDRGDWHRFEPFVPVVAAADIPAPTGPEMTAIDRYMTDVIGVGDDLVVETVQTRSPALPGGCRRTATRRGAARRGGAGRGGALDHDLLRQRQQRR